MAAVITSPAFSHPTIVEKLFTLPVVSDVYSSGSSSMEKLLSPVRPYLTKTTSSLSPLVERAAVLKAGLEDRLPESISTGLNFVKEKAVAMTTSLDSKLCSGLEQLMEHVPALKESTPILYTTSLDSATKHATSASTYVASFTLAQIVLKMSDLGLESADSLLKLVPASYEERCKPIVDGEADYVIRIGKKMAAMRKEQMKSMEGGWMRCASCRKRGSLRCAACYMTTYCGLECHEKDWGEGHRGRCRQIRKEFMEVVLETRDKDKTESPLLYFTVVVSVNSLRSYLYIDNKDDSVAGRLYRQGQEEAYDELKSVVEEQGLVQELDESVLRAGTFRKVSTACIFAHYKGKTEDGDIRLRMNVKRVQPMVMW